MRNRVCNRKRRAKRERNRGGARGGCAGKKRYESVDNATYSATCLLDKKPGIERLYVYLCEYGCHYHLSKKRGATWVRKVEIE